MTRKVSLAFVLFFGLNAAAQIEISNETAEKVEKPKPTSTEYSTEVFGLANWSNTNRTLLENEGLFGDSLGYRANEGSLNRWSFGIGLRNKIANGFSWEGGISLTRNGESFGYEAPDTAYNYETTYTYISMPLKLVYTYGGKLEVVAAVGVLPQMFMRYEQKGSYLTSAGEAEVIDVRTTSGYNSFVLSTAFNLGIQYAMSDKVKLFVIPEYRLQLTSSYTEKAAYIHKGKAMGVNLGFSVGL
ncbi:MAG: hypothetical protein EP322_06540 [Bacteroidetes bacterium]|nr:MAG: hypothetical protein EP322_06540 [Bacteroidota bacterium]